MNSKKILSMTLGLLAIQVIAPNLHASEVTSQVTEEQTKVQYAQANPTPAKVRAAAPTDIVTFTDSALEAKVAAQLKVPAGSITVSDMLKLTKVSYYNIGSSNLEGLEYATNLTELTVTGGTISDLTPISNLTNLTRLNFSTNNISDLTPISNLTNLLYVTLDNNNISDLSPLSTLSKVKTLTINDNKFTDITALGGLTTLENISLYNNSIVDLSPLSTLTKLTTLYLENTNITSVAPLANLTSITSLTLSNNNITDLGTLSNLTNLVGLEIANLNVSNIAPIANFTKLRSLNATDNSITDLSPLTDLTQLMILILDNNKIEDVSPLSKLTNLMSLTLNGNMISDLSALEPVYKSGNAFEINILDQIITLPSITVPTNAILSSEIKGINGETIPVNFGRPVLGVNNFSEFTSFFPFGSYPYNATVNQQVTYMKITGQTTNDSTERTPLTDAQLITLFNVEAAPDTTITVDSSNVDYNTPGTYNVIFSDGFNTFTASLVIEDTQPTITLANNLVTINLGETIDDYIATFGVSASELATDDLTASVTVDDSAVDYNTAGSYTVTFSVVDPEGNTKTINGEIVIVDQNDNTNSEVPSDEIIPEVPSDVVIPDVPSEDSISEVSASENTTSEVSSENDVNVNAEAESDSTTPMTDNQKNKLTTTGAKTSLIIITLAAVATLLFVLKKRLENLK